MPKLRPLPQKTVIRILENNGFQPVRFGKHITLKKKVSAGKVLTTWVPQHREITVFVIGYIIRQTEKPKSEFEIWSFDGQVASYPIKNTVVDFMGYRVRGGLLGWQ